MQANVFEYTFVHNAETQDKKIGTYSVLHLYSRTKTQIVVHDIMNFKLIKQDPLHRLYLGLYQ